MRFEDRVRVSHMIEAGDAAIQFVAGRERGDLDTDRMLTFAIVRAIEIIGEAASRISDEARAAQPDIPWKEIVGMRHRLVHAYFETDANIVWVAATEEIPALLPKLRALAASD